MKRSLLIAPLALSCLVAACEAPPVVGSDAHRPAHPPISDRGGLGVDLSSRSQPLMTDAPIDARRSLAVTDEAIVSQISLRAVLDQLRTQSGATSTSALAMFQSLWLTMGHPTCDTPLNNTPRECRTAEPAQGTDATLLDRYRATSLINRVDLIPTDASNCGQYRVVFARTELDSVSGRGAFVIFEATLPNPRPGQLAACRPIQELWQNLSDPRVYPTRAARAQALKDFYFKGIPLAGVRPVFHADNFGGPNGSGPGQVRTNTLMESSGWTLHEFKLVRSGSSLVFRPATVKVRPRALLFADSDDPDNLPFQNELITKIRRLVLDASGAPVVDIHTFDYLPSDQFNDADDNSNHSLKSVGAFFDRNGLFAGRIAAELARLGQSALQPIHVINRIKALTCQGCHQQARGADLGKGLVFLRPDPTLFGFIHTTNDLEPAPEGGNRFRISAAMTEEFLPFRQRVMERFFIATQPNPPISCSGTSGEWTACRGNGCSLCTEMARDFPRYFQNHPRCLPNNTCDGQFSLCSSNCPIPTDADRGFGVVDGGWYRILHAGSGKAVEVANASLDPGATVQQWTFGMTPTNKQWRFVDAGSGFYKIVSRTSGKVIEVASSATGNGARVQQGNDVTGANQQFALRGLSGGRFQLMARHSLSCLDNNGALNDGAPIVQRDCGVNAPNQQFLIQKVDQDLASGAYALINRASGRAIEVANASPDNGTLIQQWFAHGGSNQRWAFSPVDAGFFKLLARHSGKAMDVKDAVQTDGASIHQWISNTSPSQQFRLAGTTDGFFTFAARHSSKCAEVAGGRLDDGAPIQQRTCSTGKTAQQFSLRRLE